MKSSEYNANRQTTYIMQKLMFVIKYTLLLLAQIESLGSAPPPLNRRGGQAPHDNMRHSRSN